MTWPDSGASWIQALTFVPIFVISVIGFALFLSKLWQYQRPAVWPATTRHRLYSALAARHYDEAARIAEHDRSLSSVLLASMLGDANRSRQRLRERALESGTRLARRLEARLDGLALIATLGPLFGLFGTVVGIVLVFERLAAGTGAASPRELAGGIGTALYTTIFGLIVGVLAIVSHWYLRQEADRQVAALELVASELVDRLSGDE